MQQVTTKANKNRNKKPKTKKSQPKKEINNETNKNENNNNKIENNTEKKIQNNINGETSNKTKTVNSDVQKLLKNIMTKLPSVNNNQQSTSLLKFIIERAQQKLSKFTPENRYQFLYLLLDRSKKRSVTTISLATIFTALLPTIPSLSQFYNNYIVKDLSNIDNPKTQQIICLFVNSILVSEAIFKSGDKNQKVQNDKLLKKCLDHVIEGFLKLKDDSVLFNIETLCVFLQKLKLHQNIKLVETIENALPDITSGVNNENKIKDDGFLISLLKEYELKHMILHHYLQVNFPVVLKDRMTLLTNGENSNILFTNTCLDVLLGAEIPKFVINELFKSLHDNDARITKFYNFLIKLINNSLSEKCFYILEQCENIPTLLVNKLVEDNAFLKAFIEYFTNSKKESGIAKIFIENFNFIKKLLKSFKAESNPYTKLKNILGSNIKIILDLFFKCKNEFEKNSELVLLLIKSLPIYVNAYDKEQVNPDELLILLKKVFEISSKSKDNSLKTIAGVKLKKLLNSLAVQEFNSAKYSLFPSTHNLLTTNSKQWSYEIASSIAAKQSKENKQLLQLLTTTQTKIEEYEKERNEGFEWSFFIAIRTFISQIIIFQCLEPLLDSEEGKGIIKDLTVVINKWGKQDSELEPVEVLCEILIACIHADSNLTFASRLVLFTVAKHLNVECIGMMFSYLTKEEEKEKKEEKDGDDEMEDEETVDLYKSKQEKAFALHLVEVLGGLCSKLVPGVVLLNFTFKLTEVIISQLTGEIRIDNHIFKKIVELQIKSLGELDEKVKVDLDDETKQGFYDVAVNYCVFFAQYGNSEGNPLLSLQYSCEILSVYLWLMRLFTEKKEETDKVIHKILFKSKKNENEMESDENYYTVGVSVEQALPLLNKRNLPFLGTNVIERLVSFIFDVTKKLKTLRTPKGLLNPEETSHLLTIVQSTFRLFNNLENNSTKSFVALVLLEFILKQVSLSFRGTKLKLVTGSHYKTIVSTLLEYMAKEKVKVNEQLFTELLCCFNYTFKSSNPTLFKEWKNALNLSDTVFEYPSKLKDEIVEQIKLIPASKKRGMNGDAEPSTKKVKQ
ncbi:hypothetical protein ABK040_015592 [Willaertia magna]